MSPRPARRAPKAVPRYLEIERALRADIARLRPGDPLPSDAELCERFGVSRMTARQGVKRLADANLVFRVPGQGTFVADPSVHRRAGALRSFSDDMRTRGLSPHSKVLEIGQRPARASVAASDGPGDRAAPGQQRRAAPVASPGRRSGGRDPPASTRG